MTLAYHKLADGRVHLISASHVTCEGWTLFIALRDKARLDPTRAASIVERSLCSHAWPHRCWGDMRKGASDQATWIHRPAKYTSLVQYLGFSFSLYITYNSSRVDRYSKDYSSRST